MSYATKLAKMRAPAKAARQRWWRRRFFTWRRYNDARLSSRKGQRLARSWRIASMTWEHVSRQ